ncbi:MAG: hypothetical protein F6K17_21320 [Okeania sp. SIO3C4]|nr:hypothetical protein [Okeania sp. SIO3C4]
MKSEDKSIPELKTDKIQPNWENSIGLDAVLDKDIYLATSEGKKLPSVKPLITNQEQLFKAWMKNKRVILITLKFCHFLSL